MFYVIIRIILEVIIFSIFIYFYDKIEVCRDEEIRLRLRGWGRVRS